MIISQEQSAPFTRKLFNWTTVNFPAMLLILTLILFISKSLYNVPMSIMAIMGIWVSIKNPSLLYSDKLTRSYLALFICIWLPMMVSFADAIDYEHTAQTVFPYIRFLFAGIYILRSRDRKRTLHIVTTAIFIMTTIWSIDGLIQYLVGKNIFGYPYQPGQITGMFFPRNTIAHILAAFSPIYFESLRKNIESCRWSWLLAVPLILVVLLSGRRAAWFMLFLSICGYSLYLIKRGDISIMSKRILLLTGITVIISSVFIIVSNKPLQNRIMETAGIFSLDYEMMDIATARRFPIWETALNVFQANWVNGIGPRGFRHVFEEYGAEDSYWSGSDEMTHPHMFLLEVMSETGVIGLTGLIIFFWLFYKVYMANQYSGLIFPWALSVVIISFPFSPHMAFYGSYWSSIIWLLLILTFMAMNSYSDNQHAR
jgi:hypothetical protein